MMARAAQALALELVALVALVALVGACGASSDAWLDPGRPNGATALPASFDAGASAPADAGADHDRGAAAPRPSACGRDDDCGYEPVAAACDSDPRSNRQAPLIDQGIAWYCDADGCATLRAPPVPCEGDESCAVRCEPRPHPIAASATEPHRARTRCASETITVTCERTNICTMHRKTDARAQPSR